MHALPSIRPHDLLWIADARDLTFPAAPPDWASAAWLVQAPVVVRREFTGDDERIPVGVRGMARAERAAGYIPVQRIVRRLTPEAVVESAAQTLPALNPALPCIRAFVWVEPLLDALGLPWGVTGSAGFALATGLAVLRESSDLDLLIRAPARLSERDATALTDALSDAPARIDAQIDTGLGGFALLEWQARRGRVMLKTARGPVLVENPWDASEVHTALAASTVSSSTVSSSIASSLAPHRSVTPER